MTNGRIDDITDGAWLVLSSIALVVIFERLLVTLEDLMYSGGDERPQQRSRLVRLGHGAIMCVVGIAAATVSLPGDWVRSIVSSLGVGVGFALRDALSEALYGVQVTSSGLSDFRLFATLEDAAKPDTSHVETLHIHKENTMSCEVQLKGAHDTRTFTIPWSYLHKRVLERT